MKTNILLGKAFAVLIGFNAWASEGMEARVSFFCIPFNRSSLSSEISSYSSLNNQPLGEVSLHSGFSPENEVDDSRNSNKFDNKNIESLSSDPKFLIPVKKGEVNIGNYSFGQYSSLISNDIIIQRQQTIDSLKNDLATLANFSLSFRGLEINVEMIFPRVKFSTKQLSDVFISKIRTLYFYKSNNIELKIKQKVEDLRGLNKIIEELQMSNDVILPYEHFFENIPLDIMRLYLVRNHRISKSNPSLNKNLTPFGNYLIGFPIRKSIKKWWKLRYQLVHSLGKFKNICRQSGKLDADCEELSSQKTNLSQIKWDDDVSALKAQIELLLEEKSSFNSSNLCKKLYNNIIFPLQLLEQKLKLAPVSSLRNNILAFYILNPLDGRLFVELAKRLNVSVKEFASFDASFAYLKDDKYVLTSSLEFFDDSWLTQHVW